jgi:hypothetical protein
MGSFVYSLWFPLVLIIGAKEIYRVSTKRAIVIALFPNLFFIGVVLFGLLLFAFGALKIFTAFF